MNSSLKLMIAAVAAAGAAGGVALAQSNPNLSTNPDTGSYASGSLNNDSAIEPVYKSTKGPAADSSANASDASSSPRSSTTSTTDTTSTDNSSVDNSAMAPRADRN